MPYVFNPFTSDFDFFVSPVWVPKYVVTDEKIVIEAFGQYVIHDKKALTLNGFANITLNEGAEIIL
jgi:hypothetical protein